MVDQTHLFGLLFKYLDLLIDLSLEKIVKVDEFADHIDFVVVIGKYLAHCDSIFAVLDQERRSS